MAGRGQLPTQDGGASRLRVLGVPLAVQMYEDAIDRLLAAAKGPSPFRAHFCTVHSVVESTTNPALASAFESAELACMDGMPLVWLARLRGYADAERVCGPDVMLTLCDRGRSMGLRHFFLGGKPGTPARLAATLQERFPGLAVAGMESPPFRALTPAEDTRLVDDINASNADILWVGLGSPKQDLWVSDHQGRLTAKLLMPVGAAFDYHSGGLRRAPVWMQVVGLEWLFRLAMEPRRLSGRYVTTNVRFISLIAREEIRRRLGGHLPRRAP